MKKAILTLLLSAALALALIGGIDRYIRSVSTPYIYTKISEIPKAQAILLPGTTRYVAKGRKTGTTSTVSGLRPGSIVPKRPER